MQGSDEVGQAGWVGHVGVGWVMQGWGRVDHIRVGRVGITGYRIYKCHRVSNLTEQ